MSPTLTTPPARRFLRTTLLLAVGGALLFLALPASAAPPETVTFCHATGSQSNPYVELTLPPAGVFNGHLGADHQDGRDVIPPFEFQGQTYSQNDDAAGRAILAGHCGDDDGPSTEVPFFTAPAAVGLGLIGSLGGALLMLRRRT